MVKGPDGKRRPKVEGGRVKTWVADDSGAAGRSWRRDVQDAVLEGLPLDEGELIDGPLALELVLYRPRPQGHFGSGRNAGVLKGSADAYPATRPDATKMLRAFEDAIGGVAVREDSRFVSIAVHKRWGAPARAEWAIWRLPERTDGAAPEKPVILAEQTSLAEEGEGDEAADGTGAPGRRPDPGAFPGVE